MVSGSIPYGVLAATSDIHLQFRRSGTLSLESTVNTNRPLPFVSSSTCLLLFPSRSWPLSGLCGVSAWFRIVNKSSPDDPSFQVIATVVHGLAQIFTFFRLAYRSRKGRLWLDDACASIAMVCSLVWLVCYWIYTDVPGA